MVRAARMGLPLSLAQCGEVLKLEDRKMTEGKALIRYFSVPNKQIKQGIAKMIRHKPSDAPDKWATFKAYNIRDVDVEQAILKKVRRLEAPEFDEDLYVADQHINDRGVMIDQVLVNNAARFDELYKDELFAEARKLTGMSNPNSPGQRTPGLLLIASTKRIWTTTRCSLSIGPRCRKFWLCVGKWVKLLTRSTQLCKNVSARIVEYMVCCSFAVQHVQADGQGVWCSCKTYHKIIWKVWMMHAIW